MLINLSNHPVSSWSNNQIETAQKQFGKIIDMDFPNVNPNWSEVEIEELSDKYFDDIILILNNSKEKTNAVHVMGELNFTFNIVTKLLNNRIICVASTTQRNTKNIGDKKLTEFNFVKFRKYNY